MNASTSLALVTTGSSIMNLSSNFIVGTPTSPQPASDGTFIPNPPVNYTTGGGYWLNGWWYPYQPFFGWPWVPVGPAIALPPATPTPKEQVAIETLKLGAKVPKRVRDKALKVLEARLDDV